MRSQSSPEWHYLKGGTPKNIQHIAKMTLSINPLTSSGVICFARTAVKYDLCDETSSIIVESSAPTLEVRLFKRQVEPQITGSWKIGKFGEIHAQFS